MVFVQTASTYNRSFIIHNKKYPAGLQLHLYQSRRPFERLLNAFLVIILVLVTDNDFPKFPEEPRSHKSCFR